MGAYGRWNVGNWCDDVQERYVRAADLRKVAGADAGTSVSNEHVENRGWQLSSVSASETKFTT